MDDIVISGGGVVTVTTAQAQAAARYKDAQAELTQAGEIWQQSVAGGLIPVLEETTRALGEIITGTDGMAEGARRLAADGTIGDWARMAVSGISYVIDAVQIAIRVIDAIGKTIYAALQQFGFLLEGVGFAIKKAFSGDFSGAADSLKKGFSIAMQVGDQLGDQLAESFSAETMGSQLRGRIADLQQFGSTAQETRRKLDGFTLVKDGSADAAKKASDEYGKLLAKLRDGIAVKQLEQQQERQLTDTQKLSLDLMQQISDGRLALTAEQKRAVGGLLEEMAALDALADRRAADVEWMQQAAEANATAADALAGNTAALLDQVRAQQAANDAIGLSAVQVAALEVAKLSESAATKERTAALMDELDWSGQTGDEYRRQAQALRELAALKGQFADASAVDGFLGADIGLQIADGFDAASQSLSAFTKSFAALFVVQSDYNKARAAAGTDAAKLAQVDAKNVRNQINAYGTMAGAAKTFFKEGSGGYKTMEKAEKAFRAIELALSIKNAVEKMGLISAVTAAKVGGDAAQTASAVASVGPEVAASMAKGQAAAVAGVANQAGGDPYSAFFRIAAMAALMAGLGFAVRGGSSGGASAAPTNTGTGTVLGDDSAQSESLSKSIDLLRDVDTLTMRYSAQMLASLRNIESNIGGVASLMAQSGGIETATAGIEVGAIKATGLQGLIGLGNKLVSGLVSKIPLIGGAIAGRMQKDFQKLFGSSTKITQQGITGGPQTLGSIQERGFDADYYANTETTKKFFGIKTSTKAGEQRVAADDQTERQFSLIFNGFGDAIKAAAGPLGESLSAVQARIDAFVVDIGKVRLDGMTGDEQIKALSAVFSAQGDKIASAVLPGLSDFQGIGEGYLEAVVRVASGTEQAQAALKKLGVGAVSLANLANKQGDVAQEQVRASLVAAETTWTRIGRSFWEILVPDISGIGEIIRTLDGSAQELADTYKALTDVRTSLQLLGMSGQAVSAALIQGAGGLDALTSGLAAFEDKFFSAQEKVEAQTARMRKQFELLGVAMPQTNAQFRALVQGTDTSTEAGQQLLGGLLTLSGGFAELTEAVEAAKAAGPAAAVNAVTASADAFERLFLSAAEQTALQTSRLAASFAALGVAMPADNAGFKSLIQGIDGSTAAGATLLNGLLPLAEAFAALHTGASAASAAMASTDAFERGFFDAQERIALQNSRLTASFAALGVAMPGSAAQFKALVQGVDTSTDAGRALLNGLLPLSDAFAQLTTSIKAAGQGVTDEIKRIRGLIDGGAAGQSYAALQASFAVKSAAARSGDQSALDALPEISRAMLDAAAQQARSSADLVRIQASTANSLQATLDAAMAAQATAPAPVIPGFATGGIHSGGLRIVGERGPELEATGPARIFNASQTQRMLSGGGAQGGQGAVVAELQALRGSNDALRAEVAALRSDQQAQAAAIAGNTGKTARILERITPNGDAIATREAEALS
jgi:hypothetical protein